MEVYDEYYKSICRVCLSYGNNKTMVCLTNCDSEDGLSCFGKAVMIFTTIVLKNDNLPNYMCQQCLYLLKQAIVFRKKCEISHEKLIKLIHENDNSPSDSEIKEIISQYVMYQYYFPENTVTKESPANFENTETECETTVSKIKSQNKDLSIEVEIEKLLDIDDYDDCFQDDQHSENDENNDTSNVLDHEQDVENLLEHMERVLEMDPRSINCHNKKYTKKDIKRKSKLKHRSYIHPLIKKPQNYWKREDAEDIPKRNIECKVCNKVLANTATYKWHMQRHTGCRYVCEICAKGFPLNGLLQSHQAAMHGIGRFYVCKQCGYKAPRKWDLVEHERAHTGERPFACDKCGLTFRRRFIWKKHALYHMEKTVQCSKCPRKFFTKGEMLAHANNIHERLYVYACHECDITYAKPATVRRHLMEKHGIPREKQGKVVRINLGKSAIYRE